MVMYTSRNLHRLLILVVVTGMITGIHVQAVSANVYLGGTEITIPLGETQQHHLTIHNQLGQREMFDVTFTVQMQDNGDLAARISQDIGQTRNRIEVGAGKNRTLPVSYTASHCQQNRCDADVTVTVQSVRTGQVYSDTTSVAIERPARMRGAPGITGMHLLVISILAGVAVYLAPRKRTRR